MGIRGYRTGTLIVGVLCVLVGVLAFGVSSALAVAPTIEAESFSDVGSSSAIFSSTVNAHGVLTSYRFEYGKEGEACFASSSCVSTPVTSLSASSEGVPVYAQIGELQPSVAYEFRVAVSNSEGESAVGVPQAFTTLPLGLPGLPDGRGYEMVTPPNNENADVYAPGAEGITNDVPEEGLITKELFRAAANGDAVAFVSDPTVGGTGSSGAGVGNVNLARRTASGGWSSESVQPAGHGGAFYRGFSSDLSTGFMDSYEPLTSPAPPRSYFTPYTHSFATDEYRAAFTITPPNRSGLEFKAVNSSFGVRHIFTDASSDSRHLLFEANDALTEEAAHAPPSAKEDDLYDSVEGRLSLVNILPDGTVAPNAVFAGSHVVSSSGSRVFWTRLNAKNEVEALYVRENDSEPQSPLGSKGECTIATDACTVQVDASQAGGVGGGGQFWTATADGSEAFFRDSANAGLTGDTVAGSGANLYVYDVTSGRLSDLTPGTEVGVEGVVDTGEDGQYVYFVATGVLSGAANAHDAHAVPGGDNLYVLQRGGSPKFIGTINDSSDWSAGLGGKPAEATPDGRNLVFMSNSEVYVYDAETSVLACASCNPTGGASFAAYLPSSLAKSYQFRWISEDGSRVFFNGAGPLVPQDTNGKQDVYEWERNGSGSCREVQGCVYLLSDGVSESASWFLDASTSGNDVFVVSRAKLVPQDGNENFDVYDARVGAIQPLAPPACSGTGCQGLPGAPPIFATPSSVTFAGVGNFTTSPTTGKAKVRAKAPTREEKLANALKRCRHMKGGVKRRGCEAQARGRYGRVASRSKRSARGTK